jgi:TrmH family RNA methyltransferase
MISTRKLAALPRHQRLRKMIKMFGEAEIFCNSGKWDCLFDDLVSALELLAQDTEFPVEITPSVYAAVVETRNVLTAAQKSAFPNDALRRGINTVRHILLAETGRSQADWDFLDAENKLDSTKRRIFHGMRIYLEDIRSPYNIGSLFRTSESFGVEKILLSPLAADPLHRRAQRTAMGCIDVVPWERLPSLETLCPGHNSELRPEIPVFALETGGIALNNFPFPQCGIMIVGAEELGVSPNALALADASLGRVSIPTYGAKGSINVSAAFAIVMRAWAERLCNSQDDTNR